VSSSPSSLEAETVVRKSFVIVGRRASAGPDFSLDDLPGSSGRLDLLLRCVRAALLWSHGVRRDVRVYLVLEGGWFAPRVLRIDGATVKWLRPDERPLARLVQRSLAAEASGPDFVEVRPGIARADGGLERALDDLDGAALHLLDQRGGDLRAASLPPSRSAAFVIGDHLGLDERALDLLRAQGATPLSVGPVALHADDVVTIVSNELDRRWLVQTAPS
jgi:tRNA (pseudouridine54-N1)-methyltransferase